MMNDEKALSAAIDALNKATEANRQMVEMASKIAASFSEAAASMDKAVSKLEALSQAQTHDHEEEPAAQATRTNFSPTHEVSNDGDELIRMRTESGNSYLAYDFGATGEYKSKTEYDRLYEACLASRKEAEFHAMMLQLAQNMTALKQYEYSDEVRDAEQAILDALYDAGESEDAMDDGLEYHGGLSADWDSLLENLKKALGLESPEAADAGEE